MSHHALMAGLMQEAGGLFKEDQVLLFNYKPDPDDESPIGTNNGALTGTSSVLDRFGNPASARAFAGGSAGEVITVLDSNSLDLIDAWTLLTVVQFLGWTESHALIFRSSGGYAFYVYGDNFSPVSQRRFAMGVNGVSELRYNFQLSLLTWYILIGTHGSGISKLYLNTMFSTPSIIPDISGAKPDSSALLTDILIGQNPNNANFSTESEIDVSGIWAAEFQPPKVVDLATTVQLQDI